MDWMNVFLCACFYIAVPIQYGVMRSEAKCRKHLVLGVTLPPGGEEDDGVHRIAARFRREQTAAFWLLTAGVLPALLLPGMGAAITYLCFWLIAAIVLPFVPMVRGNKRLAAYKQERGWAGQLVETGRAVDLTAAALPEKPLKDWMFLLPTVLCLVPLIWEWLFDRTGPDLFGIAVLSISMAATDLICWLICRTAVRKRGDVVNGDWKLNAALSHIRRVYLCRSLLWMVWLTAGLSLFLWYAAAQENLVLLGSLLYCGAVILVALSAEFKVRELQRRLTEESVGQDVVDEDRWWLWGIFYYNPHDTNLMVNNRTGINTTCNLAHPVGRGLTIASMLVILLMPFLGFWVMAEENTPVTLTVTENTVVADHGGPAYELPLEDIDSAELLDALPSCRRVMGTGLDTLLKGEFVLGDGQRAKLCLNPQVPPFLLVETREGGVYLLGGGTEQETRDVYAALIPKS